MNSLTDQVLEFARSWGASLVGIVGSGCVIQKPDGTLEKVSPEEAER